VWQTVEEAVEWEVCGVGKRECGVQCKQAIAGLAAIHLIYKKRNIIYFDRIND